MEEIIKITEKNGQRAVNARELHAFLDSKQEFANWIKGRIEKYGFIENQGFKVFNNFVKNTQGRRPSIEYALSIDMAYIWKLIIVMITTKISILMNYVGMNKKVTLKVNVWLGRNWSLTAFRHK